MSGCSYTTSCPVCGHDMDVYSDHKPFEMVDMTCIHCGFYGYVKCGMQSDECRKVCHDDQGLPESKFKALTRRERRKYLMALKEICGPDAMSAQAEAEYLGLPIPKLIEVRMWACPKCRQETEWSYDDLAARGGPVCQACDCDMELQPVPDRKEAA